MSKEFNKGSGDEGQLPRIMTTRAMLSFAESRGFAVETGGRNRWKLRAPNGEIRPMPYGKDLSPNLTGKLGKWINGFSDRLGGVQ